MQIKPFQVDEGSVSFFRKILKQWFLIGTALSIVFANIWPWAGSDEGPLQPRITVKYGAVVSIFFISGITMRTETMVECIKDYKMHAFIQLFSLIMSPFLICIFLLPVLRLFGMSRALIEGFIVVGCMPPPVSTSVILTKTAGGNEAAAIFNSALGSFLGVIVTPLELLALVDPFGGAEPKSQSEIRPISGVEYAGGNEEKVALLTRIFVELSLTVVLPIIVGQFLRPRYGDRVDCWKPQLSTFASFTLLVIIYTTFCNTFCDGTCTPSDVQIPFIISVTISSVYQDKSTGPHRRLFTETEPTARGVGHGLMDSVKAFSASMDQSHQSASSVVTSSAETVTTSSAFAQLSTNALLATCGTVIMIQVVLMALSFMLSSSGRVQRMLNVEWTRPDVVAILFSSVHKSLTLGVPVLKIVFASSPILTLLSLPLLMYHPIQIVLGGMAASEIKKWVNDVGLPLVSSPTQKSAALKVNV
eukprot:CAMPEP_0114353462 /NCGR_PEP_ID=MMETSP0101-20121206/18684_1 /TAXON_ID=38822 ORGANISM="Pteridomonas danica, Strain PT" /NCGR_SAMPLE_ID=MMETSP0101 /ASSEMBLY_ACC=CAM_ASM_000211 /LENGTH=473 /DNA_ID=CAMNT_0001494315 /DNA_START=86 /DNA_END=1507 /DNA_ORIENTATION=+